MSTVVIEGSLSPSSFLARGDRMEVQRTEFVDKLIAGGFVDVISETEDPEVTPLAELGDGVTPELEQVDDNATPPARNASTEEWAKFLGGYRDYDFDVEDKDRTDLIGQWDAYLQKQAEADGQE